MPKQAYRRVSTAFGLFLYNHLSFLGNIGRLAKVTVADLFLQHLDSSDSVRLISTFHRVPSSSALTVHVA